MVMDGIERPASDLRIKTNLGLHTLTSTCRPWTSMPAKVVLDVMLGLE
jgi:hypothetical protein